MPPKRKKNTTVNQESSPKRSRFNSEENISSMQKYFKSALNCGDVNQAKFSARKCETWFHKYSDGKGSTTIGPGGVECLCKELQVQPEDIVTLVIAWKLGAENMGYFTLSEWKTGMTSLECDSIAKLIAKLEYLRSQLKDAASFKKIYRYAFDFARDKDKKSLDIDTGKILLKLVLKETWSLIDQFIEFLDQSKSKIINRDQWNSLLEFIRSVPSEDFSNYDDTSAWPVMLDEFVEWYKERT